MAQSPLFGPSKDRRTGGAGNVQRLPSKPARPQTIFSELEKNGRDMTTEALPEFKVSDETTRRLKHIKAAILTALIESVDLSVMAEMDQAKARKEVGSIVREIVQLRKLRINITDEEQIVSEIVDELFGFGPLEPLLARQDIGDIMVNGPHEIFIEVNGQVEKTDIQFRDEAHLMQTCQRIVSRIGRNVDQSNPLCDARLPDGSRVNVIVPPLALRGPTLTIRKFRRDRLRLRDLVDFGSISPAGARILAIIAASQCNVIVSGGTGSGKTTLLNCLTAFFDRRERIITLEDAAELQLQQPHVVNLETRPPNLEGKGAVTMEQLLRNALRMRPERIIVGEVRGGEAMDLLQAMNTGHDGSMGTIHANTPRDAISRMEALVTMGRSKLPPNTIREMIAGSVDVIIQCSRLRDGSRRITHITEVIGMNGDVITTQDILRYHVTGEDKHGNLIGEFRSTGVAKPKFWDKAAYFGLTDRLSKAFEDAGVTEARPEFTGNRKAG